MLQLVSLLLLLCFSIVLSVSLFLQRQKEKRFAHLFSFRYFFEDSSIQSFLPPGNWNKCICNKVFMMLSDNPLVYDTNGFVSSVQLVQLLERERERKECIIFLSLRNRLVCVCKV